MLAQSVEQADLLAARLLGSASLGADVRLRWLHILDRFLWKKRAFVWSATLAFVFAHVFCSIRDTNTFVQQSERTLDSTIGY